MQMCKNDLTNLPLEVYRVIKSNMISDKFLQYATRYLSRSSSSRDLTNMDIRNDDIKFPVLHLIKIDISNGTCRFEIYQITYMYHLMFIDVQ